MTERTLAIVRKMFVADEVAEVARLLDTDCEPVERIHLAVLKLSGGDIYKLIKAIELARVDYRDLFMAAGFGYDAHEHERWAGRF
jgi:hypothetical protein